MTKLIPNNFSKLFLLSTAWVIINVSIFLIFEDVSGILYFINYFLIVILLGNLIFKKTRFRIFISLGLGAILIIPLTVILALLLIPSGSNYNYYSDEFYESEFSSVAGLNLSAGSKIISKSDSIYGRSLGDYEHRLYCVIELSSEDREALLKNLREKNYDVKDTLPDYEFDNTSYMVPENNPLKGLKAKSFRKTYSINSKEDFQDNYIISFHKSGKIVLFILNHI